MEYFVRFLAGGVVVSLFAVVGDVLRPKSFAGLFGAAPSLALATLTLAFWTSGAYSFVVCQLFMRLRWSALGATSLAIIVWLGIAIGLEHVLWG